MTGSNGPGRDPPVAAIVIAPDIVPFEPIAPIVAVVPIMPVAPVIPAEAGVPVPFFPWVVAWGVLTELAREPDLEVVVSMVKELRTG